MPCGPCEQRAREQEDAKRRAIPMDGIYPFGASDFTVIEGQEVRAFRKSDWSARKHYLLILLPQIFTPTCSDQVKGMARWYEAFQELDTELVLVMTDPAAGMLDWFNAEPLLWERPYRAFSSTLLPPALGMLSKDGRARRGAVFVCAGGLIVRQDAFPKVAPSFSELHRILWAYSTDKHCGHQWVNPESGFLRPDERATLPSDGDHKTTRQ